MNTYVGFLVVAIGTLVVSSAGAQSPAPDPDRSAAALSAEQAMDGNQADSFVSRNRGSFIAVMQRDGHMSPEAASAAFDSTVRPQMEALAASAAKAKVDLLANEFTTGELLQIKTFYTSDVGKKLVVLQPRLNAQPVTGVEGVAPSPATHAPAGDAGSAGQPGPGVH